jgi:hypothetical protein
VGGASSFSSGYEPLDVSAVGVLLVPLVCVPVLVLDFVV